jgi:hypothetical protein
MESPPCIDNSTLCQEKSGERGADWFISPSGVTSPMLAERSGGVAVAAAVLGSRGRDDRRPSLLSVTGDGFSELQSTEPNSSSVLDGQQQIFLLNPAASGSARA